MFLSSNDCSLTALSCYLALQFSMLKTGMKVSEIKLSLLMHGWDPLAGMTSLSNHNVHMETHQS